MTEIRSVFPVALIHFGDNYEGDYKGDGVDIADHHWRIFVDDEAGIPDFEIHPSKIVCLIDQLIETTWSAEIEVTEGLIPYLTAHDPLGFIVKVGQREDAK